MSESSDQNGLSRDMKYAYWRAAVGCLVVFHNYKKPDAQKAVRAFKKRLKTTCPGNDSIYHEELFYIAVDLCKQCDRSNKKGPHPVDIGSGIVSEQYRAIRERHGW